MLLIQEKHSDVAVNRLVLSANAQSAAGRAVEGQIECFLGVLREMESLRRNRTRCRK